MRLGPRKTQKPPIDFVIQAANPADIRVCLKDAGWRPTKQQTIGDSRLEVLYYVLHSLQMEGGGPVHELRDFVDGK